MRATIHSLLKGSHEKRSHLFRILLLMDEHLERRFLTWLRLEMPSGRDRHRQALLSGCLYGFPSSPLARCRFIVTSEHNELFFWESLSPGNEGCKK